MDIRKIAENELEQAIQLSDETFREAGHTSMGIAFPHVFSKSTQHSFGAFDGDKLVGFIGLVPSKVHLGEAELNVFSLGSVCTHVDYRKQGISSAILQEVYRYIDSAGASLLFVSGDRGMYIRNHCYHYGKTYQYSIKPSSKDARNYEGSIRPGTSNDIFKINLLRNKQRVRFATSLLEWSTLLAGGGYASIFKMKQTLFVAENQGIVEGYAVIALPNENSSKQQAIVTEWGGNPKVVHGILLDILAKDLAPEIEMTIPWHEMYHEEFSIYPAEQLGHGGTIYLVDAERLIDQARPYLSEINPDLAQSLKIIQRTDGAFQLTCDQSDLTLTGEELVKVLFNVQDELTTNELQTLFPIPLPSSEGMYYV